MAFDGLTINSIVQELQQKITSLKIDKISQAEKDEILLSLRGNSKTYKLLISASPSFPRIYLAPSYKKENPLKAPNFLMILRKYIQGGRILSVSQDNFDRVIYIDIDTFDELKEQKVRRLIIEIMGRHSNIILIDKQSNKILDAAKRIPISVSSFREVLPAITYKSPPEQEKSNPTDNINLEDFIKLTYQKMPIYKVLYSKFSGLSPLIAKEICYRSNIDISSSATELSPIEVERLHNSFSRIMSTIKSGDFEPCIVFDKLGFTVDFSCIYLSMYDGFEIKKEDSISFICEQYYNTRDSKDRLNQKSHDIRKILKSKISTLENKIQKQSQEINETICLEDYKKDADLLTAYIYMIQKGMKNIEVDDFYDENTPKTTISLDENLTPSENIQKLYKKYNKMKSRKKELSTQISQAKEELDYLYNLELSIENISNISDLEDIIIEMQAQGIVRQNKSDAKKKKHKSEFNPMKFISDDEFEIYVGRNNNQNDYLTLKFAKSDDMWLHTKNIAGSHGIIKSKNGQISENSIKQAAIICAFYSKAKFSQSVPIDYTLKKNVKKPNGAKPGMVIYETNSTVYVTPDEELVERLRIKE